MFFLFSKILLFLISPFTWILFLMLGSVLTRKQSFRRLLQWISLLLMLVFSNVPIAEHFMQQLEMTQIKQSAITKNYDYGIVLTGFGSYDLETENFNFQDGVDRLTTAMDMYKQGKIRKLIISGGSGSIQDSASVADHVRAFLIRIGFPEEDILSESKSRNTYENAVFTKNLLPNNIHDLNLILITSASHMRRANACFKTVGIDADLLPVDHIVGKYPRNPDYYFPSPQAIFYWQILLKEHIGYIVYQMQGYI